MVKFDQRLDAKRAKRQKRQNEEALGDDELSQMGWVAVDADIESIFEQVTFRLKLRTRASHQQEEYNKKKRPRDADGTKEAWAAVDVNSDALFAGNTESGFVGLEELKPGMLFDANSVAKRATGKAAARAAPAAESPAAKTAAKKPGAKGKAATVKPVAEAAPAAPAAGEAPPAKPTAAASKKAAKRKKEKESRPLKEKKERKEKKEEPPVERPSKETLDAMTPADRDKALKEWAKAKKKRETRRRREQRKRVKAASAPAEEAAAAAETNGPRTASGGAAGPASEPAGPPLKKAKKGAAAAEPQPPAQLAGKKGKKAQQPAAASAAAAAAVTAPKQLSRSEKKKAAQPPALESGAAATDGDGNGDGVVGDVGAEEEEEEAEERRVREALAHAAAAAGASGPWASLGVFHKSLLEALSERGFTQPTVIQQAALPAAIAEGRDIIGAAETGSGKTLAFGLPILQRLCEEIEARPEGRREWNDGGLRALILTPTRELAMQVTEHLKEAPEKQQRLLGRKPEIVVATPGRLWELISQGEEHLQTLGGLRFLVLDEADRMVERGHFGELVHILDMVESQANAAKKRRDGAPAKRQTFVFSATLTVPPSLRRKLKLKGPATAASKTGVGTMGGLMEKVPFGQRPKIVDVTDRNRIVAAKIVETAVECSEVERDVVLYYLLRHHEGRTLVFANAISAIRRVSALLTILQVPHAAMHGQMQQRQRLRALDRFKEASDGGRSCALVATDVAARGIDIEGIKTVIHYQVPPSAEVYVHRSGRTARGGADGLSILLSTPTERSRYTSLLKALGKPESMTEFPVDSTALTGARKRIILAGKIDKLRHSSSKAKADRNWLKKSADELDIVLDDDDRVGGEGDDGTEEEVSKRKEKGLQGQLAELLAVPLGGARLVDGRLAPSRKYPTVASGLTSKKLAKKAVPSGKEALVAMRDKAAQAAAAKAAARAQGQGPDADGEGEGNEDAAEDAGEEHPPAAGQGKGKKNKNKFKNAEGGELDEAPSRPIKGSSVVRVAATVSAAAAGPGAEPSGAAGAAASQLTVEGAPSKKRARNKFAALEEAAKAGKKAAAAGVGGAAGGAAPTKQAAAAVPAAQKSPAPAAASGSRTPGKSPAGKAAAAGTTTPGKTPRMTPGGAQAKKGGGAPGSGSGGAETSRTPRRTPSGESAGKKRRLSK